ncbi:MAG: YCF48-related protein [bacterium]|nr:YCF48-related protein [bacterium]
MKLRYFVTLLSTPVIFLLSTPTLFAQGWEWQNPLPQGNRLYAVDMLNDSTGWIAGEMGVAFKTTDYGVSWSLVNLDTQNAFLSIAHSSPTSIWFHSSRSIQHTTDGGETWRTKLYAIPHDIIANFSYFDSLNLYASNQYGLLFHSSNGGNSWDTLNCFPAVGWMMGIDCTSDSIVWIVGSEVNRSTDCGRTWAVMDSGVNWGGMLYCVSFSDINHGWVAGSNRLYKTINGGLSWVQINSGINYEIKKISCVSDDVVWLFSQSSFGICEVSHTTNGGTSWITQRQITNTILGIHGLSENAAWIVGWNGHIKRTTNHGVNWTQVSRGVQNNLFSIAVVNSNTVCAVGDSGIVLITTNRGQNWNVVTRLNASRNYSVHFIDSAYGWVSCSNGRLGTTTDGGITWETRYINTTQALTSVNFTDRQNGWVVGSGGVVFHTSDGGENWISQTSNFSVTLNKVCFLDQLHGWAISIRGTILRTTDGGTTWNTQWTVYENSPNVLSDICFSDSLHGWIVGGYEEYESGIDYSVYLTTTDGGNTWIPNNINSGVLQSVYFSDPENGWLFNEYSAYHTTNHGQTWSNVFLGSSYLYESDFVNPNTGWVVGTGGTIRFTTDETSEFVSLEYIQLPSKITLHPNYPNPFNASTSISYSLPLSGAVELKVFDLNGREVQSLYQGYQRPGTYRLSYNATGLPSGTYFYRLQTGEQSQTRKMILMK